MRHEVALPSQDQRSDRSAVNGLPRGSTYIYFFGTEDGTEVKLGRSSRPHARKAQHENQAGFDKPLEWLACLIGSHADERKLKSYFRAHTSRDRSDEWVQANDEVRGYLRFLRALPYVASSPDVNLALLERVDSANWLPNGARRKSPTQLEIPLSSDPWADLATSVVMEGDFYTHPKVIAAVRAVLGGVDLDPASCAEANRVVEASHFFGAKENGLCKDWWGRVWINPPFGSWGDHWTPKLLHELHSGRISQLCALASTRAITAKGFHPMLREADAIWISYGRFPFWGPKATSPDEGHVVLYFGPRVHEFHVAFGELGTVFAKAPVAA